MKIGFRHLAVAAAAVAGAAVAVINAPFATAQERQNCNDEGPMATDVVCQSPGNVQINDSLPVYDEGFMTGMYGGPYPVPFAEGGI